MSYDDEKKFRVGAHKEAAEFLCYPTAPNGTVTEHSFARGIEEVPPVYLLDGQGATPPADVTIRLFSGLVTS